jgi:ribonucleoside-triphosphate reductase
MSIVDNEIFIGDIFMEELSIKVVKKNGTLEDFDINKVINAVKKSSERVLNKLTDEDIKKVCERVKKEVVKYDGNIDIKLIHNIVEGALEKVNKDVAKSYKDYRNYKQDFVGMLDKVYKESQKIMYLGDKSNANADSTLVTTKRSLMFNALSTELYKKFFLTNEELQAVEDACVYVHDISSRLLTTNCCVADIANILKGGFEMSNIWYNEPKTLDVAFGVIADIVMSASGCMYGGFSIPNIDTLLEPYAEKTLKKLTEKYLELGVSQEKSEQQAWKDLERMAEQGFQEWEYKFNTLSSARGDFSFISASFGLGTSKISKMLSKKIMEARANGEGKEGNKKPVLFPKLIFLYDENLHGEGKELEDVFNDAIECNKKSMYPDYISLSSYNYVSKIYQQYGTPITCMGCRSFLSPFFKEGGLYKANEQDKPIFIGRGNVGVISLNLPMIFMKAKQESKDFYEVLDYYLELIRKLHLRTIEYLGEMKASLNPLMFTQGGFYGGHLAPDDKIKPVLKSFTTSFGITALNELQRLYNKKSIREDGEFALEVMRHINQKVDQFKEEDGVLHSIYFTPAESLCKTQVDQFRLKYGIIENVSDRDYFTNGFHCHVSEDITPIEKQDLEGRFLDMGKGGQIFFNRFNSNYNTEAFKTLVRRAMKKGFYYGTNLNLSYCEECGYEELEMTKCPKCGSTNITSINRVCGYLGFSKVKGDTRFNEGKLAEVKDRVSY